MFQAWGYVLQKIALDFFIAFGVVFGACMLAGIGAVLTLQPPGLTMKNLAENIKIWAVVVAIGGSIDPVRYIEFHLSQGEINPAIKQVLYIIGAFMGAHIGTELIKWICDGGVKP